MSGMETDKELALRSVLEDAGLSTPFLLFATDRLQKGVAILNETADAESAAASFAEILSDPKMRGRLVKEAIWFAHDERETGRELLKEIADTGQITDENARARLHSGAAIPPPVSPPPFRQGDMKQLIEEVAAAKLKAMEIDERARRFFAAAGPLGFTPGETEKARCGTAYFRYLHLEEALTEVYEAVIGEFGKDEGGPPVSEKFIDRPFEHFAKTLAGLWLAKGRDFRREGMQDFEKVLRALIEGMTGQEIPANRWQDLKRDLKKGHNPT